MGLLAKLSKGLCVHKWRYLHSTLEVKPDNKHIVLSNTYRCTKCGKAKITYKK